MVLKYDDCFVAGGESELRVTPSEFNVRFSLGPEDGGLETGVHARLADCRQARA